ncbi:DUF6173 family protein [Methylobacterium sp. A54F]
MPALIVFAAGIEATHRRTAQNFGAMGLGSALSGLKSGYAGAASQALATGVYREGVKVGEATPIPEKLASAVAAGMPRPAEIALERFGERLKAFEAQLDDDHEVAVVAVSAPGGPSFFVQETTAISRELISLRGFDDDGGPAEVVQHHSQFNLMLMPVRKVGARGPLGFTSRPSDQSE